MIHEDAALASWGGFLAASGMVRADFGAGDPAKSTARKAVIDPDHSVVRGTVPHKSPLGRL